MNRGILAGAARITANAGRRVVGVLQSSAGVPYAVYYCAGFANALQILKSSLVANQWTDAIVINGRGCVNWAAVEASGSVINGYGRLIIDGNIVATTTATMSATSDGAMLVGAACRDATTQQVSVAFQPIYFESQCVIQVKVSTGGTAMYAAINAEVHA